eukprot:TRINITY_DN6580_c0_g1_i1.p1 TRINITY_DN6580_c0_g1~~TRINITY_DN6580_c0_g1_i1.p1  ORF type:complete len:617 (-),score=110.98 TRINITY_DN6580_c0_g1_i1:15-1865(-)
MWPVGKALATLLSSSESFEAADVSSNGSTETAANALRSLRHHLQNHAASTIDAMCVPLIEQIVQSKDVSHRLSVFRAFEVAFELPSQREGFAGEMDSPQTAFILKFTELLESGNKRWKLAVALLVRHLLEKSADFPYDLPLHIEPLFHPLVTCIKEDSAREGLEVAATRLTVVAADCLLAILHSLASKSVGQSGTQTMEVDLDEDVYLNKLWTNRLAFFSLLQEMIKWHKERRPMFVYAINQILVMTKPIQKQGDDQPALVSAGKKVLMALLLVTYSYLVEERIEANPLQKGNKKAKSSKDSASAEILALLSQIKVQGSEENEEEDDSTAVNILLCACLLLGKLSPKQFLETTQGIIDQMLPVLTQQVQSPNELAQNFSVQILRRLISQTFSKESAEAIIDSMMDMLGHRDTASKALVGFVAEFVAKYPARLLPKVFDGLDAEEVKRRNSLDILTGVFEINRSAAADPHLGVQLAEQLLLRISDEQLALRTQAAQLFANVDPVFIIPKLAQLTTHKDARTRSAADSALLSVLGKHSDVCGTIETLLDCLRQTSVSPVVQPPKVISPADIAAAHRRPTEPPRSYGTNLPSSFSRVLSSALEYSSRPPVSVCGTVSYD